MKFNPSFLSKILIILTLAFSPSLDLHSQVSAEDVKRSLMLACNEVSLKKDYNSKFEAFSKACKDGDCVKAAKEHLTSLPSNIKLVKEIDQFCNASFLEGIELNASSSEVAKKLVDKINKQKKIQWFINKNNRSASVQEKLKVWLDEFTPSPTPTPSNPSTSKGNSNTKDAWPLDDPN